MEIAAGPSIEIGGILRGVGRIFLAVAVALVGLGGAIAIFVVVLVRRSRRPRLAPRPPEVGAAP